MPFIFFGGNGSWHNFLLWGYERIIFSSSKWVSASSTYTLIHICSKASHIENILYMRHLTSALKIFVLFYIEFLYIYMHSIWLWQPLWYNYLFKKMIRKNISLKLFKNKLGKYISMQPIYLQYNINIFLWLLLKLFPNPSCRSFISLHWILAANIFFDIFFSEMLCERCIFEKRCEEIDTKELN